jgi:hypothetical protein
MVFTELQVEFMTLLHLQVRLKRPLKAWLLIVPHPLLNTHSCVRELLLVVELRVSQVILILLWERLSVAAP